MKGRIMVKNIVTANLICGHTITRDRKLIKVGLRIYCTDCGDSMVIVEMPPIYKPLNRDPAFLNMTSMIDNNDPDPNQSPLF
jgi:hypothetical protein